MLHSAPVVAVGALACVLALPRERRVVSTLIDYGADERLGRLLGYLLVLSALVFLLVLAEFKLVSLTSSLTLSVFGVLKELLTVCLAVAIGDAFSALNGVGVLLCLSGNILYFCKRTRERRPETEEETPLRAAAAPKGGATMTGSAANDSLSLTLSERL